MNMILCMKYALYAIIQSFPNTVKQTCGFVPFESSHLYHPPRRHRHFHLHWIHPLLSKLPIVSLMMKNYCFLVLNDRHVGGGLVLTTTLMVL